LTAAPQQIPSSASSQVTVTAKAGVEDLSKLIRLLPPDDFPELPESIISTLRGRGCMIPQPGGSGPPRNVIHGDFFGQATEAWAALCSRDGFSTILVFRDSLDALPAELARMKDVGYLQDVGKGELAYSRNISPVDREFIMCHYLALGGPKPPPIHHHGIEDAFLEKASVTHYWYEGKWLRLQGAD
jgi:hypothetical protein